MARILTTTLASATAFAGLALALSSPAYAYLDPGTGSIIIQSVIGGIAAVSAFGAMYWSKFKAFLARVGGKPATDETADD